MRQISMHNYVKYESTDTLQYYVTFKFKNSNIELKGICSILNRLNQNLGSKKIVAVRHVEFFRICMLRHKWGHAIFFLTANDQN